MPGPRRVPRLIWRARSGIWLCRGMDQGSPADPLLALASFHPSLVLDRLGINLDCAADLCRASSAAGQGMGSPDLRLGCLFSGVPWDIRPCMDDPADRGGGQTSRHWGMSCSNPCVK